VSTTATPEGVELFDGTQYDSRPEIDGYRPDLMKLALSGSIDIDPSDQQQMEWFNNLRLGRLGVLTVTYSVAGKVTRHGVKGEAEEDHIVHQVTLKVHRVDAPPS
jgi:hypothetical protein